MSSPEILHEQYGGVLIAQKSSKWTEKDFEHSSVRKALEACGMTSHEATELFLGFAKNLSRFGSFSLSQSFKGRKIEAVVGYYDDVGNNSPVSLVHYYPAFVRPNSSITTVFGDTAELILGIKRAGILEVVPTVTSGGNIMLDRQRAKSFLFTENTFAILPQKIQGNRWSYFPDMPHNLSSFIALFTTFPKPYARAERIPVTV